MIAAFLKPFVLLIFGVLGVLLVSFLERKMPESKLKRVLLAPVWKRKG